MGLRVMNTETGKKEEFRSLEPGKVAMYVCGPTVYDHCHVGHARSYVAFDIIRRYLEFSGYQVTYIQNFTDVDDKIINRANEKGIPPLVLSENFIQEYFNDMGALNIKKATVHPKASETVPDMITAIKALIERGFAYESSGSVYFEVERAKDRFGRLRHQSLDDMLDGARVDSGEEKRDQKDFALWKAAKPGEISWDSPWGKGRPGWHIECSTMAEKYVGRTLDIHGGGMDLIFPHHESEILQAESLNDRRFANYWLHNGFVEMNKEKMSKSLGNFFTIREILSRYEPMVLRFFLAYTHYRSSIEFSDAALDESARSFDRLRALFTLLQGQVKGTEPDPGSLDKDVLEMVKEARKDFMDAMDDDFNTRIAITVLFKMDQLSRKLQKEGRMDGCNADAVLSLFNELTGVLGLDCGERRNNDALGGNMAQGLLQLLIDVRARARKGKDFATSDMIRDRLKELGIVLEDGEVTKWKSVM